MPKNILLASVTAVALLSTQARADLASGRAAVEQGDYARALEELRPLAASDKEAAYQLADMYRHGWGIAESWATAAGWYKKAAMQGHAAAQFEYGQVLEFGRGVVRSRKDAYDWYRKAANQGHAQAMTQVGRYHLYGIHRRANFLEARRWLNKAAEAGDAEAQALIDEILRKNALILDIPGTANPTEEAAKRVLGEVKDLLAPLLGNHKDSHITLGHSPTVMSAEDGHVVVLPMVEIAAADQASIRFGNIRLSFTPDGDDYSVRMTLPPRAGLVAPDKTVVGHISLGRQEVAGRWSTALHTLTDYRAELGDIEVTITDSPFGLVIGAITGERSFKPSRAGHYDVVEKIHWRDMRLAHEADGKRMTASLGSLDYMLQYLDMDVVAVGRVAERFGIDWRTGVSIRDVALDELPDTFPPMLRDMLVTVQAKDFTVEGGAGKRLGGFGEMEFSVGGANLNEALSALSLTYAHQKLSLDGPAAAAAPNDMRVNVTANRLPLANWAAAMLAPLHQGMRLANGGNAMEAAVAAPMALLATQGAKAMNAALGTAKAELRINEVSLKGDGYEIAMAGQFRPSRAGLSGALDVRIVGADRLAQALRDAEADLHGLSPADLLPPRHFAVKDKQGAEFYRLALLADGSVTVNGKPLAAAQSPKRP